MTALLSCSLAAFAGVHVLEEGQTTAVPLNTEVGTVLQLPGPVRMVTPTAHVLIERVDTPPPAKGGKADTSAVQHLRARVPDGQSPQAEFVTIVLASGEALNVKFVPAPGADPFADLQRPKARGDETHTGEGFLGPERELMLAMFRDDPYRREVLDAHQVYEQYPELSWHLRRRFRGDGLTGYAFVVRNEGHDPLQLDPSVLAVDRPNRAVLVAVEDELLGACKGKDAGRLPCETVVRIVVRELGAPVPTGPTSPSMPFIRVADKGGSR